mmetsp:Transcript_23451/g.35001  ORF Transcript_23451/g.35001 Transcript_23451/m.35001 type:complete len:514 (+) Transcript_23451:1321-2862(+)
MNRKKKQQQQIKRDAELFTTVCLSGWLRDLHDFQRPWGIQPSDPPITDRQELLERFYSVYNPNYIFRCKKILNQWKGEEKELWNLLRMRYGRDPDHLYPFEDGPRIKATLNHEENEIVDNLIEELGYYFPDNDNDDTHDYYEEGTQQTQNSSYQITIAHGNDNTITSLLSPAQSYISTQSSFMSTQSSSSSMLPPPSPKNAVINAAFSAPPQTNAITQQQNFSSANATTQSNTPQPDHIVTTWDYQAEYGGELYTVKWESKLMLELCDSVTDMAVEALGNTAKEVLKFTSLATLLSAVAIPLALANASNFIDSTWVLAIERAEEAGIELANSLLESQAGHRPVTLIGFSVGARVIYACLKELAKHQEKWEDQQEEERQKRRENQRQNGHHKPDKKEQFKYMREPASIVEDVIVMGTPNHVSIPSWAAARRIVAGRIVNCYSRRDYVLSLMFRFKRARVMKPICGTTPIDCPGIENVDVSDLIATHSNYCLKVGEILRLVCHGQPQPPPQVFKK